MSSTETVLGDDQKTPEAANGRFFDDIRVSGAVLAMVEVDLKALKVESERAKTEKDKLTDQDYEAYHAYSHGDKSAETLATATRVADVLADAPHYDDTISAIITEGKRVAREVVKKMPQPIVNIGRHSYWIERDEQGTGILVSHDEDAEEVIFFNHTVENLNMRQARPATVEDYALLLKDISTPPEPAE